MRGYNALKDFYKTEVFELSKWRNAVHPKDALAPAGEVIPERIITKPPSAELREDQKDEDSLPPYDVLDDILRGLVDLEEDLTTSSPAAMTQPPCVASNISSTSPNTSADRLLRA